MNIQTPRDNCLPQGQMRFIRGESDRAGDVLRLLKAAAEWMESNGIKQWTPGQFNEADIAGYFVDRQVYLALDGDQVVGLFTLQFSDFQYWGPRNDESYAYLHRLSVADSHRGTGLGRQMLDYAVSKARELGCLGLRFDTVAHNVKLNRYYQSLGFHYMGTHDMGGGRLVNLYQHFEDTNDGDEVILRYSSEADFGHLQRWSLSPEFLRQWAGPSLSFPLTEEQLQDYLAEANHPALSDRLIYSAVHKATQEVIGHISLASIDRFNGSARLSRVVVDPAYRGRGIGQRMVNEVLRIAFDAMELRAIHSA